jgi:purine nucleoside permease
MPDQIRVLVLTMFEREFEPWERHFGFSEVITFPGGPRDLLMDRSRGILLAMVGVGAAEAAASTVAIGLDPRFDLTDAYIILVGIGGGDPNVVQLGSVVVGDAILDSDLAHEIDAREIPAEWSFGRFPLFRKVPFEQPPGPNRGELLLLDDELIERVLDIAHSVALVDPAELDTLRQEYADWSEGLGLPQVVQGAVLAGSTLWHGTHLNQWAAEWASYWTEGQRTFAVSSMEDAGIGTALRRLTAMGRLNVRNAVVLRGICNFTVQPSNLSAADSLAREEASNYSAIEPAVENAYLVGSAVARALGAD